MKFTNILKDKEDPGLIIEWELIRGVNGNIELHADGNLIASVEPDKKRFLVNQMILDDLNLGTIVNHCGIELIEEEI